jgi:multiple sugar transport system substrate-binding protein
MPITTSRTGKWIAATVSGLLGLSLAACGSSTKTTSPASKPASAKYGTKYTSTLPAFHKHVTLVWWSWLADTGAIVKAFEKAYPSIKVDAPLIGSGTDLYTKLTTSLAAGTGAPDVAMIEYENLPQYVAKKGLLNISSFLAPYKADFPGWAWNLVSSNGGVYSVPQDQAPMGLIYDATLLKKYGLAVPTTYAEFAKEASTLHKDNPKLYLTAYNITDSTYFSSLVWQAGGQQFKETAPNTWKLTINDAAGKKVLNYWGNLIKSGDVLGSTESTPEWDSSVAAGDFATYLNAVWWPSYGIDAYAKPNTLSYTVTKLPQWTLGGDAEADYGGSTNAVTSQSKNPKAAELFATFLNLHLLDLAETPTTKGGGGYLPANVDAPSAAAFKTPVPNMAKPPFPQFWPNASHISYNFNWSPFTNYFSSVYETEFAKALAGKETFDQALDKMESDVVNDAKASGYAVSS